MPAPQQNPPHSRFARLALRAGAAWVLGWLVLLGCVNGAPQGVDDLCAIFDERPRWRRAAHAAHERWGVTEPVMMAFMHQESRFQAKARPPRERVLGLIPRGRATSAYGYGQVKDGTWADYQQHTGRAGAQRDRFGDVADFIGWYAREIERLSDARASDPYALYLAYHEGPGGYARRSFEKKPWLKGVARKVAARAERYARQYARCGGN